MAESEHVEEQPWPQTPSLALELLSLQTPTVNKRPATADGGPEATQKRRTFDRPSRQRVKTVKTPQNAHVLIADCHSEKEVTLLASSVTEEEDLIEDVGGGSKVSTKCWSAASFLMLAFLRFGLARRADGSALLFA
ncbi:hypothetical protein L596_016842 [Steinernema carpocapsae]|uniref:Uncharacterized protein n=1 Tax=Steinernema carpocapsae TaxID=34508 RepID=A0A4U5NJ42_STECR|nr:hypothetical protein L596_016842 [Steinernema carpocapsae]